MIRLLRGVCRLVWSEEIASMGIGGMFLLFVCVYRELLMG